jgi:predicted transcriptional regulator
MRVSDAIARARETAAWEMRQQGYRQTTIAEKLGVGIPAVSQMLTRLEARVLAELTAEGAAVKARVTMQLWTQYEDLRKLFEASKAPQRKQRMRRRGGLLQQGRAEGAEAEILESSVEERIGDVAIFREMRATLETILKVWGGFAPTKIAPTSPDGNSPYAPDEPLSTEERERRVRALFASLTASPPSAQANQVVGEVAPVAPAPRGKGRKAGV